MSELMTPAWLTTIADAALLEGLRDSLPIDHPERPGIIRAIEILRSVIEDEER